MIVELIHKTEIDDCIAKEIENLNNIHNIKTIYSCCGHQNNNAFILVYGEKDIRKMLELGYIKKSIFTYYIAFQPKSECKCDRTITLPHAKELLTIKSKGIPPSFIGLEINIDIDELKEYYNNELSEYLSSVPVRIMNGKIIKHFTFEEFLKKLDIIN